MAVLSAFGFGLREGVEACRGGIQPLGVSSSGSGTETFSAGSEQIGVIE